MAIFTGEFIVEKEGYPAIENAAYLEKYREGIKDIQMTPESFSESYSVALRFQVQKVRAF